MSKFNWPFKNTPRPAQIQAMEWLIEQKAKYLILEAPVGSGKSNIGLAYSSYLAPNLNGNAFILTPQRILQSQYEESFKGNTQTPICSLYGRSNYPCSYKRTDCEIGSIVKPRCKPCPYELAKGQAKVTSNVVMNYKIALMLFSYTTIFDKRERDLIILDECHTTESHLIDFDSVNITYARSKRYQLPWAVKENIKDCVKWLSDEYLPALTGVVSRLGFEVDVIKDKSSTDLTQSDMRKIKEYDSLCNHSDEVTEISLQPIDALEKNFVLVFDKTSMVFKRLRGAYSFNKILDKRANRFLFMSSTILDKNGFCFDLGINPEETAFLSLGSDFPKENRPVIFMPQMKMNHSWKEPEREKSRQKMLLSVKKILDNHNSESGIIHTANYTIAKWLVENLQSTSTHKLYHHNPDSGDDRNAVINAFMADPAPSVLISPSSTEGLDLKDDLGRFAIFVKVPFGNLGDQWIKKRMLLSKEWYQRRALIDIIQGGGRVVRSATDKGIVYILDESWSFLMNQAGRMIPKWWIEGYRKQINIEDTGDL